MTMEKLLSALSEHYPGDQILYMPYDIRDTKIAYGTPAIPISGLDHVIVKHRAARTKLVMGLSGTGSFVDNINMAGSVEIGILAGSVTGGGIEMAGLTGIPFPILISDLSSGGTSGILASACRLTVTPDWRREATPGVDVYVFETPRLLISRGLHLPQLAR
jgi:hypothetical protein